MQIKQNQCCLVVGARMYTLCVFVCVCWGRGRGRASQENCSGFKDTGKQFHRVYARFTGDVKDRFGDNTRAWSLKSNLGSISGCTASWQWDFEQIS